MLAGLATPDQRTYALLSEHYAKTGKMSTALEIAKCAQPPVVSDVATALRTKRINHCLP